MLIFTISICYTALCEQHESILNNNNNTDNNVTYQLLSDLKQLRHTILNESNQLITIQNENTKLTEENQKLQYRIDHLKRSIQDIQQNKPQF